MSGYRSGITIVLFLAASVANGAVGDIELRAIGDSPAWKLSEVTRPMVALHFLVGADSSNARDHIARFAGEQDSIANLEHVFVAPQAADWVSGWTEQAAGRNGTRLYQDEAGTLADYFAISPDAARLFEPAVIVIDRDAQEILTVFVGTPEVRATFCRVAHAVASVTAKSAHQEYLLTNDLVALERHDPVAYFTMGQATKGMSEITSIYRGVTYYFENEGNRAAFADNPEAYLPAYGGWCATAMAKGDKIDVNPKVFKISDGRLFLFHKRFRTNAKKEWAGDEIALMRRADAEWNRMGSSGE